MMLAASAFEISRRNRQTDKQTHTCRWKLYPRDRRREWWQNSTTDRQMKAAMQNLALTKAKWVLPGLSTIIDLFVHCSIVSERGVVTCVCRVWMWHAGNGEHRLRMLKTLTLLLSSIRLQPNDSTLTSVVGSLWQVPGGASATCAGTSCGSCESRFGCLTEAWGRCCVQFFQMNGKRSLQHNKDDKRKKRRSLLSSSSSFLDDALMHPYYQWLRLLNDLALCFVLLLLPVIRPLAKRNSIHAVGRPRVNKVSP